MAATAKSPRQVISFWSGLFTLPWFLLVGIQLLILAGSIRSHELSGLFALKLLALVAGQLGVMIGVAFTPLFIRIRTLETRARLFLVWPILALVWLLFFEMGWSAFLSIKLHRLIFPEIDGSVLVVFSVLAPYALVELLVISWRLQKRLRSA